jgi:hypothetical protein
MPTTPRAVSLRRFDLIALVAIGLCPCASLSAGNPEVAIVFVDASLTSGDGDGWSWSDAFQGRLGLQQALQSIAPGSSVQIWIAGGEYAPAQPGGSRDLSFVLQGDISLFGGFAGGETSLEQRDPVANPTILTGDLNDDDPPGDLQFGVASAPATVSDNSRHVVRIINPPPSLVLDGVTIERGHSDVPDESGANLRIEGGSATIQHCLIQHGLSWMGGGGVTIFGASPLLSDCTFTDNHAGYGGGVLHAGGSTAVIEDCRFERNRGNGAGIFNGEPFSQPAVLNTPVIRRCDFLANGGGANFGTGAGIGIFDREGELLVESCKFIDNKTVAGGGGMYLLRSNALVRECIFTGNEGTGDGGGAVYVDPGLFTGRPPGPAPPQAVFINCQFNGNNGAMLIGIQAMVEIINCTIAHNTPGRWWESWPAFAISRGATVHLVNTVIWGHTPIPHEINGEWDFDPGLSGVLLMLLGGGKPAEVTADHCRIEFWDRSFPGVGTTAEDPLFVDSSGVDGLPGTVDDDLRVQIGSPCIDSGDNAAVPRGVEADLDGNPRFVDGDDDSIVVVDIGAFERPPLPNPADLNGDGQVNGFDLALLLGQWGRCPVMGAAGSCPADLDGSGAVGGFDLAILLAAWGQGSSTPR